MKPEKGKPGILYVVSTPIGNLEDITLRALRVLREADLIAAEDTRRTRHLLTHYGVRKPLISYHEHNRRMREGNLLRELREGKSIALVTDAGTPGISDPGADLVRAAIQESIPLVPIPGPAALIAALSVSGLPTESFLFYGFLPSKSAARKKWLATLKDRPETLVFYESPRRARSFLQEACEILGDRRVVMAREMTKVYEEIFRGTVSEVLDRVGEETVQGEVTIILEGCALAPKADAPSIAEALKTCMREMGLSRKESVERVTAELKVSRREVYQQSLRLEEEE